MIRFIIVYSLGGSESHFLTSPRSSIPKEKKQLPTSSLGEYKLSIRHSQQTRSTQKQGVAKYMAKNLCVSQRPYKLTTLAFGSYEPASLLLDRTSTDTSAAPGTVTHREKQKQKSDVGLVWSGLRQTVGLARMIAEDAFCADKQ